MHHFHTAGSFHLHTSHSIACLILQSLSAFIFTLWEVSIHTHSTPLLAQSYRNQMDYMAPISNSGSSIPSSPVEINGYSLAPPAIKSDDINDNEMEDELDNDLEDDLDDNDSRTMRTLTHNNTSASLWAFGPC